MTAQRHCALEHATECRDEVLSLRCRRSPNVLLQDSTYISLTEFSTFYASAARTRHNPVLILRETIHKVRDSDSCDRRLARDLCTAQTSDCKSGSLRRSVHDAEIAPSVPVNQARASQWHVSRLCANCAAAGCRCAQALFSFYSGW